MAALTSAMASLMHVNFPVLHALTTHTALVVPTETCLQVQTLVHAMMGSTDHQTQADVLLVHTHVP